jgi:hypothetical protein
MATNVLSSIVFVYTLQMIVFDPHEIVKKRLQRHLLDNVDNGKVIYNSLVRVLDKRQDVSVVVKGMLLDQLN